MRQDGGMIGLAILLGVALCVTAVVLPFRASAAAKDARGRARDALELVRGRAVRVDALLAGAAAVRKELKGRSWKR
jgi:hypothetical protein